ncbi:MAG: hypothetical protein R6W90_03030 [Ignavibacteriaceae bacterium]
MERNKTITTNKKMLLNFSSPGCFIFILFIMMYPSVFAQSTDELEKRFENIQLQITKEQHLTDSLNILLTQKVKQIDSEKNKKKPDNEIVVQLMSSSASISNSIDKHQERINELTERRSQFARQLIMLYNSKIDSLKKLEVSGAKNPKDIEADILFYTEKRLLVEPGIQNLSFNPSKILTFDTNRLKDKKGKSAYAEYLQNALKEVNTILSDINEKNSEVSEILLLQKKTQKFLKEIEFEGRPGSRKYSANTEAEGSVTPGTGRGDVFTGDEEVVAALNSKVYAYNSLLTQLAFDKSISANLKWDINLDKNKDYDLNDYKDLLAELKRNLQEYKEVLKNKLDSVN